MKTMETKAEEIGPEALKEIQNRMLSGVVNRASLLCFFWAGIGTLYGFASLELFHTVAPELTLIDNVVPRFFFNSIPALFLGNWYRNYKINTTFKAYSTIVVLPLLLISASVIHAWPLFWQGHHDFYYKFHASNIVAVSTAISVSAGPPIIILGMMLGFLVLYFGPLIYLFSHDPNSYLTIKIILSDLIILGSILIPGLINIYKLRLKLAITDYHIRKKATPFLGTSLAEAIYGTNSEAFKGYSQHGSILSIDIRGYTNLVHTEDKETVRQFISEYHSIMVRVVSTNGGFVHKSNGDGHIISFGIMERETDLSDLPNISTEETLAKKNRDKDLFKSALATFEALTREFEALKLKWHIDNPIKIGAGLASGPIEVVVRGDAKYRQELDIDGETIVRATRLESYSKYLSKNLDNNSSFFVISPEFSDIVAVIPSIKKHEILNDEAKIRDYTWIDYVYFRQWKHDRARDRNKAAA